MPIKSLYYKITPTIAGDSVWYARGLQTHDTPEASLKYLQKLALKRKLPCTYELATHADYLNYISSRGGPDNAPRIGL